MKWTPLRLALCYSELVEEFGPRSTWQCTLVQRTKQQPFKSLCQRLANAIDVLEGNGFGSATPWARPCTSPGAVMQQFAFSVQANRPRSESHGKMWDANRKAAILAGFIE